MKKLLLSLFFLLSFLSLQAKDNVVSKDTVVYNGSYKMEQIRIPNEITDEIKVRYYVYLNDLNNKKVLISKQTFEKQKITYIVYKNYESGARKISSAF